MSALASTRFVKRSLSNPKDKPPIHEVRRLSALHSARLLIAAARNVGTLRALGDVRALGGPGSGNFGHAGRPGEVGGSSDTWTADDISDRYPIANEMRAYDERDAKRVRSQLREKGRLNADGTTSLYHVTLSDPDSIPDKGLLPAFTTAPGQDWAAEHSKYATYFFLSKEHAIDQVEQGGGSSVVEARVPINGNTLSRFVPDEDSSSDIYDGVKVLVEGGAVAFIGGVPPQALKIVHGDRGKKQRALGDLSGHDQGQWTDGGTFYHGTSSKHAKFIEKEGLKPGSFMTDSKFYAKFYGGQDLRPGETFEMFEVKVPKGHILTRTYNKQFFQSGVALDVKHVRRVGKNEKRDLSFNPDQARDDQGQWTSGAGVNDADVADVSIALASKQFPRAPLTKKKAFGLEPSDKTYRGGTVDGLVVRTGIPNTDSIGATFYNSNEYDELPGIREVALADLDVDDFAAADDERRVAHLAEAIKESGEISPLIVVIDGTRRPYVLEGGHRVRALKRLGKTKVPAVVIVDHTAQKLRAAGDLSGHEFHGNQWTDGHGTESWSGRPGEVGGSGADSPALRGWTSKGFPSDDVVRSNDMIPDHVKRLQQKLRDDGADYIENEFDSTASYALQNYTGGSYGSYNANVGNPDYSNVDDVVALQKAIIEAPEVSDLVLTYRGTTMDAVKAEEMFKPGTTIEMQGFQSTSFMPETAAKFLGSSGAVTGSIKLDRGTLMEIQAVRGLYVRGSEDEFLLPHGSRFEVLGFKDVTVRVQSESVKRRIVQLRQIDRDEYPTGGGESNDD